MKKVATKTDADKTWNYPEAALEEIVANCLYHRDYKQREPIEIQVEPREKRLSATADLTGRCAWRISAKGL